MNEELNKLKHQLKQLEKLKKLSIINKGSVKIDQDVYTLEELNEMINRIKINIAIEQSNNITY